MTKGEALIEICAKPLSDMEILVKQCIYEGWSISAQQTQKLLTNLEQDRLERLRYLNLGNTSFLKNRSEGIKQHNCLTWCEEHLEKIGIDLRQKKSILDVIVAHPTIHFLNQSIKNGNIVEEPYTQGYCVLM